MSAESNLEAERDEAMQALVWCLTHGVQAGALSMTGYYDGDEPIMPPAVIHRALDRARQVALSDQALLEERASQVLAAFNTPLLRKLIRDDHATSEA